VAQMQRTVTPIGAPFFVCVSVCLSHKYTSLYSMRALLPLHSRGKGTIVKTHTATHIYIVGDYENISRENRVRGGDFSQSAGLILSRRRIVIRASQVAFSAKRRPAFCETTGNSQIKLHAGSIRGAVHARFAVSWNFEAFIERAN